MRRSKRRSSNDSNFSRASDVSYQRRKKKHKRTDNFSHCSSNYDIRELEQPPKTEEDIEYEWKCEDLKEEMRKKKIYDSIFN